MQVYSRTHSSRSRTAKSAFFALKLLRELWRKNTRMFRNLMETRTEHPICYNMTRVSVQKKALQTVLVRGCIPEKKKDRLQGMCNCARVHQKAKQQSRVGLKIFRASVNTESKTDERR